MSFYVKKTYNLIGGFMSKIEFKNFVKKNMNLVKVVESGETTWQKLYELYDLYGETSTVWDKYLKPINQTNNFKDIINLIKGIDLNTVQKGLLSLDKAIDAFKDLIPNKNINQDNYEPRPTYKYFED